MHPSFLCLLSSLHLSATCIAWRTSLVASFEPYYPKHIVQLTMKTHSSHSLQAHCGTCASRQLCVRMQTNFLFLQALLIPSTHLLLPSDQNINTHQWLVTQSYLGLLVPLKLWTSPSHKAWAAEEWPTSFPHILRRPTYQLGPSQSARHLPICPFLLVLDWYFSVRRIRKRNDM